MTANTTARVLPKECDSPKPPRKRAPRFSGGEVDSPTCNLARHIDRMADFPNPEVMMVYRLDRSREAATTVRSTTLASRP